MEKEMEHLEFTWFWCDLCMVPAVKFECCGNISCSGGGCDVCFPKDDTKGVGHQINEICNARKWPYEQLKPENPKQRAQEYLDKLFGKNSRPSDEV